MQKIVKTDILEVCINCINRIMLFYLLYLFCLFEIFSRRKDLVCGSLLKFCHGNTAWNPNKPPTCVTHG